MQQFRPGSYSVLPPVVKNLIIINVIFYIASLTLPKMGIDLTDLFGLHYFGAEKFYPFQFITYMFMHSMFDIFHILMNMFALWMFGASLENYWGPKKFVLFYFVSGIGAALVHYTIFYFQMAPDIAWMNAYINHPDISSFNAFINSDKLVRTQEIVNYFNTEFSPKYFNNPDKAAVLQATVDFMSFYKVEYLNAPNVVGASGAVFGILLGFGMMFPNSVIYLYFAIPVKAKYFVIGYGAIELWSGIGNNANDNVAHFAHLGGMLFGLILILIWKKKKNLYTYK